MREKCVQWSTEHSFPDACSSSVQNGMVLSQKKEEELMRAVQEYTAASRGKEDLDEERIKEIAEEVLKDKNTLPDHLRTASFVIGKTDGWKDTGSRLERFEWILQTCLSSETG